MADRLDLSIVVPAFNAELTLERALRSTFPLLDAGAQCIVVDDGSTDSTRDEVARIQAARSGIILVTQANAGLSAARNAGIDKSKGEWITFLDADDELVPDGIISALAACQSLNLLVAKTAIEQKSFADTQLDLRASRATTWVDSTDPRKRRMEEWLLSGWGGLLGCVFSRGLLSQMVPPFVPVPFGEDLVFTFQLAMLQEEFASVQCVGYRYSVGGATQMTSPHSRLRLDIHEAFKACEALAKSGTRRQRILLWLLVQRYRWSSAPHVAPPLRNVYRTNVATYASGLRRRLGISRKEIALTLPRVAGSVSGLGKVGAPRRSLWLTTLLHPTRRFRGI